MKITKTKTIVKWCLWLMALAVVLFPSFVSARLQTQWFANNGIDQPFNWINQPTAISFEGWTYVVYQAGIGFLPTIQRFNESTQLWSGPVTIADSNPISGDGHGAPSIAITPDRKIHVFYGAHESALKYVRGSTTTFPSGWVAMPNPDSDATYPHPMIVGTKIYLAFRAGGLCAGWAFRISSNSGDSWSSAGIFLDADNKAYIGGMEVHGTSIFFQWVNLPGCGGQPYRNNSYVAYYNTGDNGLYCQGQRVSFSLTAAQANAFCQIEKTPAFSNFGPVHVSQDGTIRTMYLKGDGWPSGDWQYKFAKYVGVSGETYAGKKTDCYALRSDAFHAASRFCDGNTATDWQDSNGAGFPRWIVTNLTSERIITKVAVNSPAFPGISSGTLQVLLSDGSWYSDGTYTIANCNSGSAENNTVTLTIPAMTTAYRLYFTSAGCASYVDITESWPYGVSSVWSNQIVGWTDHFQDYGDFWSTNTVGEAYILSNTTAGSEGGNVELYTYDGTSFTHDLTILTKAVSGAELSAPMVPLNFNTLVKVVFDQRIMSLTSDNSKVYAWGVNGFMGIPITPSQRLTNLVAPFLTILILISVLTTMFAVFNSKEDKDNIVVSTVELLIGISIIIILLVFFIVPLLSG